MTLAELEMFINNMIDTSMSYIDTNGTKYNENDKVSGFSGTTSGEWNLSDITREISNLDTQIENSKETIKNLTNKYNGYYNHAYYGLQQGTYDYSNRHNLYPNTNDVNTYGINYHDESALIYFRNQYSSAQNSFDYYVDQTASNKTHYFYTGAYKKAISETNETLVAEELKRLGYPDARIKDLVKKGQVNLYSSSGSYTAIEYSHLNNTEKYELHCLLGHGRYYGADENYIYYWGRVYFANQNPSEWDRISRAYSSTSSGNTPSKIAPITVEQLTTVFSSFYNSSNDIYDISHLNNYDINDYLTKSGYVSLIDFVDPYYSSNIIYYINENNRLVRDILVNYRDLKHQYINQMSEYYKQICKVLNTLRADVNNQITDETTNQNNLKTNKNNLENNEKTRFEAYVNKSKQIAASLPGNEYYGRKIITIKTALNALHNIAVEKAQDIEKLLAKKI